jgi:hypothetical protein
MNPNDVLASVAALMQIEVESLDLADLDAVVALSCRVRGWHDSFDLRCARRAGELQRQGQSSGAEAMFNRAGKRSAKEGATIGKRAEVGDELPGFGEGLASGEVSAGHLDALANVRGRLDDDTRRRFDEHEHELFAQAANERVDVFARRCRALADRLTPARSDADELDAQRARSNVKRWVDKVTGMHHTHLELDPVRDATVWNAVNRSLAKLRRRDGSARTPWQQMQVNAFVAATQGGVADDPTDDDTVADDVSTSSRPHDPDDRPSAPERTGSDVALRWIEQRLPEITVLVDLRTIIDGLHDASVCETEDGVPLPVSTVRRLCCDAEIIPAVLGTRGELLELGRTARTVNRAQRRALRAMHRTCGHHDCTVPFSACRIHHVRFWVRDRGPTDIDNLLPLCERHHHLVHEGRWTVTMTPDRVATWTRPDGTVDHRGSTIDRRPEASASSTPQRTGHPGQSGSYAEVHDRRPHDRPMIA